MTAVSGITGERVNLFNNLLFTKEDLLKKVEACRLIIQRTAACHQKCPMPDFGSALYATTYEMDKELGTRYHKNLIEFVKKAQENDWAVAASITDVKGQRRVRPSEQVDPDMYVRVVEKRSDGVVIRGAKAHQAGASHCHVKLILPAALNSEKEKDYAIACWTPTDAEGIIHILGRQPSDTRKLEGGDIDVGNANYSTNEFVVIYDNVFVP